MSDFQTAVNFQPGVAVAGDFCSANPRANVLAGPGALVADAGGLTIGRFAWVDGAGQCASNQSYTGGAPSGFVSRHSNIALITTFLGSAGLVVPKGLGVTLHATGDFWVQNDGTGEAVPGQKCYANYADGKATFAATGSPTTGATSTASSIAAAATTHGTASSITGNVLTVGGTVAGTFVAGATLSGTNVVTGTKVVKQLTGTAGGAGTYEVDIPQTVASTTITAAYGVLTVGGTLTGNFGVGDLLSGSGVTAGTYITQLGTGSGGAGTYYVNNSQTVASEAIDAVTNVETNWVCRSFGAAGELVKISQYAAG